MKIFFKILIIASIISCNKNQVHYCSYSEIENSIKDIYLSKLEENISTYTSLWFKSNSRKFLISDALLVRDFKENVDFKLNGIRTISRNEDINKCNCAAELEINFSSNFVKQYYETLMKNSLSEYEVRTAINNSDLDFKRNIEYSIQMTDDKKNYYIETAISSSFYDNTLLKFLEVITYFRYLKDLIDEKITIEL